MSEFLELEKKGLKEALNLEEDELYEAKFNLLGFYSTLQKIEQRLINEGQLAKEESV